MKKLLAISILILLISCKENTTHIDMDLKCPTVAREGSNTQLVGKWKLVQGKTVFNFPRTFDYSCNEVIYDFRLNGILIVSADIKESIGASPGEHTYEFIRKPVFEGGKDFTLKINDGTSSCKISNGLMTLDDSPLDGPILYFARM